MKLAVVSHLLPPFHSGQAMMLYRLLKDVRADDYCLVSTHIPEDSYQEGQTPRLAGKYAKLSDAHDIKRGNRYGLRIVREALNVTWGAFMRARQIARVVREEDCKAIVSCSSGDDLLDVPSGLLASRLTGAPFYVYLFDTYSHMWLNPQTQFIGRLVEPMILKRASGIIVTNESVQELLRNRYGVASTVIHNPCDIAAYEKASTRAVASDASETTIVYTGAVYQAHIDALTNLVTAIDLLGAPGVKLHLYTSFSADALAKDGIRGPVVIHPHQPVSVISSIQRAADILFLPFAFKSPYPELIKISSPSKIGEYLAARRPVLVHAPAGSFVSNYFRQHECGLVVDRDDPGELARAIDQLRTDEGLRHKLAANAWQRAVSDFSLSVAQAKFAALFNLTLEKHDQVE